LTATYAFLAQLNFNTLVSHEDLLFAFSIFPEHPALEAPRNKKVLERLDEYDSISSFV
jgi:hypothetical protein